MDAAELVHSVAQDLTALHDSDLIVTGLVRRVRAGLGCDLAYVSLNDPASSETCIRFCDGVRTTAYGSIRMPIGTGVLGMAAAGVTTESPDYLPDLAKLHIEAVDVAVNEEGVRAILGTPLRAGGNVVGALTVANRVAGHFSTKQRALLEEAALIGSAAIEIYLLRREIADQQRAFNEELARLRDSASASIDRLRLSERFASALAAGKGSSELIKIATSILGGSVRLAEDSGEPPAVGTVIPLRPGVAIEFAGSDARLIANLAPVAANYLSIALLYENAIEDARHLRESELVERLVDPSSRKSGGELKTGLSGSGDLQVVVVDIEGALAPRSALSDVRRELGTQAISALRRGSLIVISRADGDVLSRLSRVLIDYRHYGGVASTPSSSGLAAGYTEALLVTRAMRSLGRANEITRRSNLGVVAFAIGDTSDGAKGFVDAQLGPIAGAANRDRILRETALAYLDAHGSVSTVAVRLRIHENTVRQRLDSLDRLLPEWRRGPRSLDIHVALRTCALLTEK